MFRIKKFMNIKSSDLCVSSTQHECLFFPCDFLGISTL